MKNNFDFEEADKFAYDGILGADYSKNKTVFRMWQPFAESVTLRLYLDGKLCESLDMRKSGGKVWKRTKSGDCKDYAYDYLITRNGETVSAPDPYSRAVTEDGERSLLVRINAKNPRNWYGNYRYAYKIAHEPPVVYELSVRDFSMDESANFVNRGKFAAFCENGVTNSYGDTAGLEYIRSLGVTHIQLMPVFDFDLDRSVYNWGYNPRFYNIPSRNYTNSNPIFELKELINAIHKNGMGVVADVVYNHLYSAKESVFERIFPGYYFRHNEDGSYSNGSGCGNEFASERKMARKFITDSLEFLVREYKLDGFRFDLMGLLDIETMREAEQKLHRQHPNFLLYGEGWTGGESALEEEFRAVQKNAAKLPGIAFFNDSFRDGVKGSVFDNTDCGYVNGVPDESHLEPVKQALTGEFEDFWTDNSSQTVNYVECHDNLTLFDKLTVSMKGSDKAQIIKAGRMAAAFTLLSQGIAFIQAGQEFLRSKNGEHNSYNLPDSVNSIKWDLVTENRAEVEYYKGLIAVRKRLLNGLMWCRYMELDGGFVIYYKKKDSRYALVVNPTGKPITAEESLEYDIYADGERASETVIRKTEGLRCGVHSILFAEVKQEMMKRLTELRRLMNERNISAYIVCTDDFHGSEYVGDYFKLREYLSGFTGSAGTLVVLPDTAALWTDGRYFIQAEKELSGSGIELMKAREKGTPSIAEFLAEKLPENSVIGFDGRAVSASFAEKLLKYLAYRNITEKSDEDLGGMVWDLLDKRPELSCKPVYELPGSVCGFTAAEKIEKIRENLKKERADCLVISALDEIAWTLNLRGNDIEYNPVFLSYMIISQDEVLLFANKKIFPGNIAENLEKNSVKILGYFDIYNEEIWLYKRVWLDSRAVNFRLKNTVKNRCEIIDKKSPVSMMKAVKNPAEIKAIKLAHLVDGCAVTRFMYWLKKSVGEESITEISAADKLEEFRKMSADYLGQSFAPIMAYGGHGAIVHYSATEDTDVELQPRSMLLSDTGGHYLGENAAGTTDITRTFVLGKLTEEEKRTYTLVLAAHLELLNAKFPRGIRGSVIDHAARRVLWEHGMDFKHGTGHGVGFLLCVHEGPQRISCNTANDPPIEPGMIISCEPGYYAEGKFGIRHESLMLCVEDEDHAGFLRFEPLTLVPFDKKGIDTNLLTDKQVVYLNAYHKLVYDKLPKFNNLDAEWLKALTNPIKKRSDPSV